MNEDNDLWRMLTGEPDKEGTAPKREWSQQTPKRERGSRSYVAFDTRDRADALSIYPAAGPSQNPAYSYLMNMSYEHHFQSAFQLFYPFMTIEVEGENLDSIVHAINYRRCETIRQFHPKLYDPPAPSEPIIHKITLLAGRNDRRDEEVKPDPTRARQEEQA